LAGFIPDVFTRILRSLQDNAPRKVSSGPSEAGKPTRIVRPASGPGALWPSPSGQPKVLAVLQGFSELLGGTYFLGLSNACSMSLTRW
jgi:hypothetical protein